MNYKKEKKMKNKCELYNDHFQNYKRYHIPKAQLVIADIPYNLGNNAYASSPEWYVGGGITLTEKVKKRINLFLIQTTTLKFQSLCTFAQKCY